MVISFVQSPEHPARRVGFAGLKLYKSVRLRSDWTVEGIKLARGTTGIIVDQHGANDYGIEFGEPIENVLILPGSLLERTE